MKKSKMAAPPVEDLGAYNPHTKAATVNKERISHWMKMGAQPTVTVHNLLVKQGVISGKALPVKMKKAVAKEAPVAAAPVAETKTPEAEAKTPEVVAEPAAEEPKAEAA